MLKQKSLHKWKKVQPYSTQTRTDHSTKSHRTPTTEVHRMKHLARQSTKITAKTKQKTKQTNKKQSTEMGRQRKSLQSKGTEDSRLKELNEMDASKLSHIEFKRMVISMLKDLTDNYNELSGNYNSVKKET